MASTGLLVISNVMLFSKILPIVKKYVSSLYVQLNIANAKAHPLPTWGRMISKLYMDSASISNNDVDLRILVLPLRGTLSAPQWQLKPVDLLFSDSHSPELCEQLRSDLKIAKPPIYLDNSCSNDLSKFRCFEENNKVYNAVVLGGTFDRIHIGHKIFLSQAVLRACHRLVVGVTMPQLNKSKTLAELILPVEQRISDVKSFLTDIDPSLQYEIVPIEDPFGPTKSDPDMDLIIVSAETLRGGHKVNELRTKNNLRPLEIFCIDMVQSNSSERHKESKVSSSNARIDLLGTRLKTPELRPHLPDNPYIIGLTGGIASGKSKMAERLKSFGASVMDCDKIAHELYEPDQVCFEKLLHHFGRNVLNSNGRIDRAILGSIVFNDPLQLKALNDIVWPELLLEVKRRISSLRDQRRVVVIEAAILLKAGWETECHEVWSMIIPPSEAISRIITRNNLTEEQARQRLDSQVCNEDIVAKSNVVFSSLWDSDITHQQAERAWDMLMGELGNKLQSNKL